MKLEQFAKEYGLNTRAVNGLYDLKKRADRGEYPHDSDPRVRRLFNNNIEMALIIVVKAHLEYWRDRDNPNVSNGRLPMLWRCTRVGNKTIINIIDAVYAYLDDPNTPDNNEAVEIFPPEESKPTSAVRRKKKVPSINYIHFDMDLLQYCTPKDYELTKTLTFTVTSHTNKKYANSHCSIILEKDMGDLDEVVIVEEMPLQQLKRLQKFIEMVLELDR